MRLPDSLKPVSAKGNDFDVVRAAHLLNRCGFGGTPDEIARVRDLGTTAAVEMLLDFPDAPAEEQSPDDVPDLSAIEGYPRTFAERRKLYEGKTQEERQEINQKLMRANREAVGATVAWWLNRMAYGATPLQEKLTFFWHGHFTTSARDERSAWLMWQQNELLRRNSAGNFRRFVHAISRDPAMLDYLNNSQNRKQHPNENYARELMELFTLGIGNYSENDIREAARAFTGWSHDGEEFRFRKNDHDEGEKVLFGVKGNLDGDDAVDIILRHKACAPYIAGRLWAFFVYEEPEPEICQALGQILRENKWDLRPVLYTMFTSKAFYSDRALFTQIKSPVQLVVGTVRLLNSKMPQTRLLVGPLDQMGQIPLAPPTVKGWPGGRSWINTSTLLVRYNTASMLVEQARGEIQKLTDSSRSAEATVDTWVRRLLHRPITPEKRNVLLETISGREDDENAVRSLVQLIVSMPEYQLC